MFSDSKSKLLLGVAWGWRGAGPEGNQAFPDA